MKQIPEEHDPLPLGLLFIALGLAIWMAGIASLLLWIRHLIGY